MPRFTVQRMMAAVAVAALASLALAEICRNLRGARLRVMMVVCCVVVAAYSVWAMRRPLWALFPLLLIPVIDLLRSPPYDGLDIYTVSMAACYVAWIIGAPVGWIVRRMKPGKPIHAPDQPGTTP
jgi:hypothetical protein